MKLATITATPKGAETRPPLLIAHGLFGSARNWNTLARRLADGRRVIAVDMRNHGDSPRDDANGYADMAGDLAETIAAEAGGRADVLGHSMGGKAAMLLALTTPLAVRRLIVADIAPVPYAHTHAPYIAAMQAVDLASVRRRADAERQLAPLIEDRALRGFLLQSLAMGADGPRWKLNLPALAAAMDEILAFPAVDGTFPGPALFLAGGASDYLGEDRRSAARALFPNARFETIAAAGHWLHVEAPEAFVEATRRFLDA